MKMSTNNNAKFFFFLYIKHGGNKTEAWREIIQNNKVEMSHLFYTQKVSANKLNYDDLLKSFHFKDGNKERVVFKNLILSGCPVNSETKHNHISPLHWAIANVDIELSKFLIKRGMSLNTWNSGGYTPLGQLFMDMDNNLDLIRESQSVGVKNVDDASISGLNNYENHQQNIIDYEIRVWLFHKKNMSLFGYRKVLT